MICQAVDLFIVLLVIPGPLFRYQGRFVGKPDSVCFQIAPDGIIPRFTRVKQFFIIAQNKRNLSDCKLDSVEKKLEKPDLALRNIGRC